MNAHEANVWAERLAREEKALRKASPASELGDLQRQLHKIERDISSKLTAPAYGDSKSHMTGARERRKLRAQAEILERMQARVRNASDVAHRAERHDVPAVQQPQPRGRGDEQVRAARLELLRI